MAYPCVCGASHTYADEVERCKQHQAYAAERDKGATPEQAHAKTKGRN